MATGHVHMNKAVHRETRKTENNDTIEKCPQRLCAAARYAQSPLAGTTLVRCCHH